LQAHSAFDLPQALQAPALQAHCAAGLPQALQAPVGQQALPEGQQEEPVV